MPPQADPASPRPSPPRTWLIVLTYEGRDLIGPCLESVARQEEPSGGVRCLVVDNASQDGTAALVRETHPGIEVVENGRNLGFAAGNNVGIRLALAAGAEYVALLNMDARVDPGWLRELVMVADANPHAALVGARIHTADGRLVEFDGGQFDPITTAGGYAHRPPRPEPPEPQPAAYACGAAVLMRSSVLAEIGLLRESFFAYHEDVELSLRAQLCGHTVLHAPGAVVYHQSGGAGMGTGFRSFMGLRNLSLTLAELYDGPSWRANGPALADLFLGQEATWPLESLLTGLFEAPRALAQRRRLKALQQRSYSEVAALHGSGVPARE